MDYTKFNVEDLASDESFLHWVHKTDPEAVEFWEVFKLAHPDMIPRMEKARTLVINLKRAQEKRHHAEQVEFMWQNIEQRIEEPVVPPARLSRRKTINLSIAASVTLLLVSFIIWHTWDNKSTDDLAQYTRIIPGYAEQVNDTGRPMRILLNDGSVVLLSDKGHLKYKANYDADSSRDVYLLGEAFFEVSKNPYKPFIVHANEVVTEVLGTSFRVQAHEDEKHIVVSVKTGKVSVYAREKKSSSDMNKRNGVILLPNQEVSYARDEHSFDKKLIATPEVLPSPTVVYNFTFENTPVQEVFKTLEEAYGIEIIFNEDTMKNCYLTAPLGSEPLFDKLKIICQTIGASYEVIDANVVISSVGC